MGRQYRRSKRSAGTQQVASWDVYDSQIMFEPSAVEVFTSQRTLHQATFLGSETAPDGAQVRRSLQEMRKNSLRRKSWATCAATGCALLAVILTQRASSGASLPSKEFF
jgi:hypothetical protein